MNSCRQYRWWKLRDSWLHHLFIKVSWRKMSKKWVCLILPGLDAKGVTDNKWVWCFQFFFISKQITKRDIFLKKDFINKVYKKSCIFWLVVSSSWVWVVISLVLVLIRILILVRILRWNERIRSWLISLHKSWWCISWNEVWRLTERRWGHWGERGCVCLITGMVELHHLVVVHGVHILQILLVILPNIPVLILKILSGTGSFVISISMIKWSFPMSSILNEVLLFLMLLIDFWCVFNRHLLFFLLIVWFLTLCLHFILFVVFRLNRFNFIFVEDFSSLNVKDLLSEESL